MEPNPLMPSLGGPGAPLSPPHSPPVSSLERVLNAIGQRLAALEGQQTAFFNEVRGRLDDLENSVQELEPASLGELEDKLEALQRTVEGLESTLSDVESSVSSIESTVSNIESTVDRL